MHGVIFDDLPQLIDMYSQRHIDPTEFSYSMVLVAEAKKKIRQLRRLHGFTVLLCKQIRSLQPDIAALAPLNTDQPHPIALQWIEANDSLEMYTELFYYVAWRLRQVIRQLPKLQSFDPEGIRIVRNHLVEHPESHGQDVLWAFTISEEAGPILLRSSESTEGALDKGLWPNAFELTETLRKALAAAS